MDGLGERLRAVRRAAGKTLDVAASQAGITKGYLSRIENGRSSPSIAILSSLAAVYGVPMGAIFDAGGGNDVFSLVRANERLEIIRDGSETGYRFEAIAFRKTQRMVETFIVTMPPGVARKHPYRHAGEELFFILEGRCRFLYGSEEYVLEAGDTVYFDSSIDHRGDAHGDVTAVALAVVIPPPGSPAPPRRKP